MTPDNAIIESLSSEFSIPKRNPENFMKVLSDAISYLIQHDFARLVQILYRMDIPESRLTEMLAANTAHDAGEIIAALIVERESQKLVSRRKFKQNNDIPEDERW